MSDEKGKSSPNGLQDANSDAESLRGPTVDPLTGEHQLVRQLKNRHIAMIRLVVFADINILRRSLTIDLAPNSVLEGSLEPVSRNSEHQEHHSCLRRTSRLISGYRKCPTKRWTSW
jgi:hypothetical protein